MKAHIGSSTPNIVLLLTIALKSHEWIANADYEPLVLRKGGHGLMTNHSIQYYWILEGHLKGLEYGKNKYKK